MTDAQKEPTDLFLEVVALIEKKDSIDSITEAIQKLNIVLTSLRDSNKKLLEVECLFYLARAQQAVGNESKAFEILETLLLKEKSLSASVEQLDIHDTKNLGVLLCVTRLDLAKIHYAQKRYNEAIDCFFEAANYFLQKEDKRSAANVYQEIANIYQEKNDIRRAVEILQKALETIEHESTPSLLLELYFRIGHYYYLAGDLSNAILYESIAIKYAKDTEYEFVLTNNLANFTFDSQRFRDAIPFLKRLLHFNEHQGDISAAVHSLLRLGASYGEIGDYLKGMAFYEKAKALLEAQKRNDGIEYALYLEGKAQILVDTKEFSEAKDLILQAERFLKSLNEDLGLLERLRLRIKRGENPLSFDCIHRIINMALINLPEELPDVEHTNPQPVVSLSGVPFITSRLSDEDRAKFYSVENGFQGLFSEMYPVKWLSKGTVSQPGAFMLPLHFEYVDDLEEFEIKWTAYKEEKRKREKLKKLQLRWNNDIEKISHQEGRYTGGSERLISYLTEIVTQVQGYVSVGDKENTRSFALHAADFFEIHTNDKFLALLLWKIRAELLLAIHPLTQTPAKRLLETEILHSLKNADKLVKSLDRDRQKAALPVLFEIWWDAEHLFLDSSFYIKIVEMAQERAYSFKNINGLIYGIALYKLKRCQEAVSVLGKIFPLSLSPSDFSDFSVSTEYQIVLEALLALANSRVLINCPDLDAWNAWLGPFAPYIYTEITGQTIETFLQLNQNEYDEGLSSVNSLKLAFIDENFVVMKKSLQKDVYAAALVHEIQHGLKRSGGQMLRTETGQWVQVKRDVPVASAETYLNLLKPNNSLNIENKPIYFTLNKLLDVGRRCVVDKKETSHIFIQNMLQYFDDLHPQESKASYPCAAVLIGMALGFFGEEEFEKVQSYIEHLAIYEHKEAMEEGRVKAKLEW